MPNLATLKLIGYGVGALAVIALLAMVNGWRVERDHLRAQAAATCAAIRSAAANPKMDCKNTDAQIRELGGSIANLKAELVKQNAAVAAMADASRNVREQAEKAISSAMERVKAAEGQSDRLASSSRDPARLNRPCEPSDALKGAWK